MAFYRDGVELKRHSTADLIKNPSSVKRSVSHYEWMNRDSGYPRLAGNSFYLETVEGRVLEFDVTTGMMVGEGAKR